MTDVAACLLCIARPQYLRKTISSLENCEDKDRVDWYIFQDGAVSKFNGDRIARDKDVEIANKIIRRADLPDKTVEKNEHNLGIPNQFSKAFSLLDEGYEKVIVFEDDLAVSKYAIRMSIHLSEEYPNYVPSIYSRPETSIPDGASESPEVLLKSKSASFKHAVMSKGIYDDIRDRRDEYMDIVGDIEYTSRNHEMIKEEFGSRVSSHDSVVNKILHDRGYFRLKPILSRGMNIGAFGLHTKVDNFIRRGRQNSSKIEYETDSRPKGYKLFRAEDDLF